MTEFWRFMLSHRHEIAEQTVEHLGLSRCLLPALWAFHSVWLLPVGGVLHGSLLDLWGNPNDFEAGFPVEIME